MSDSDLFTHPQDGDKVFFFLDNSRLVREESAGCENQNKELKEAQ